jgi:NADH:ubiquinone oxidoreductase subunit E
MASFLEHAATEPGQITDDGLFTIIEAECLGACGFPTAVQVNERYFENVTPDVVPEILERLRSEAAALGDAAMNGSPQRTQRTQR